MLNILLEMSPAQLMKKVNSGENGKKCPKCGAVGRYHGEHYAAFRQMKAGKISVVNVGWRCWNCGHEWGFEALKE